MGRVGPIELTEDGVEAELRIEKDDPRIPDSLTAVVANLSAVGEQYVDLRPTRAEGPFLGNGSVIDEADTTVPAPPPTYSPASTTWRARWTWRACGPSSRSSGPPSKDAATTSRTTRVTGDVSSALSKVFSYGPGATAATRAAAKEVLAGKALQQYAALFGQVERQSADQKLTLTTEVVRAGVTRLTDDSAHLLVFLDQVHERRGRTPTTASAQLTVVAELRDGRWWIVEIGSI
ncbi:hypothetical protein SBADM41S_08483 [Streptomyces badius]